MSDFIFDIYAHYGADTRQGLDRVRQDPSLQADWRIALLASALAEESGKEKARHLYRDYLHRPKGCSPYDQEILRPGLDLLERLRIEKPPEFVANLFPEGSWMLQFQFTLAKPYLSRDDEAFYVIDNPVRKDKIFRVPSCSGASWKGNLRWTAMKRVVDQYTIPDPAHPLGAMVSPHRAEAFAEERFRLVRLFGDEKGEETGGIDDVARYLDSFSDEVALLYRSKIKRHFGLAQEDAMPHHKGRLFFYPTLFNKIGLEVINPHDRSRRVGTQPIYFECVPAGAKGTFSLLYVPFDVIGKPKNEVTIRAKEDLVRTAEAIKEMFLTYGFSAKKSSGFGVAHPEIENGRLYARWLAEPKALQSLQSLAGDTSNV